MKDITIPEVPASEIWRSNPEAVRDFFDACEKVTATIKSDIMRNSIIAYLNALEDEYNNEVYQNSAATGREELPLQSTTLIIAWRAQKRLAEYVRIDREHNA